MDSDIINIKSLAEEVERRYENDFKGGFPYNDCYALQKMNPKLTRSIIPDLDEYFGFIAGYSSSATRLNARSGEELRKAVQNLKRSFFDKHPEYNPLKDAIAETMTLSRKMHVADELRRNLVIIIDRLE